MGGECKEREREKERGGRERESKRGGREVKEREREVKARVKVRERKREREGESSIRYLYTLISASLLDLATVFFTWNWTRHETVGPRCGGGVDGMCSRRVYKTSSYWRPVVILSTRSVTRVRGTVTILGPCHTHTCA